MATVTDVLVVAKQEIGVTEQPFGSNKVKYNEWYYNNPNAYGASYPWCMVWVQWVFAHAGCPIPYKTASCTALMEWAKAQNLWDASGQYCAGDIVIYCSKTSRSPAHCGIVVRQIGSTLITIEGNTGSQSMDNGGAVKQCERTMAQVLGVVRLFGDVQCAAKPEPTQEGKKVQITVLQLARGAKGKMVASAQALLNAYAKANNLDIIALECDGSFGTLTDGVTKAVQKHMGVESDGIIGVITWSKLLGGC